MQQRNRYRSTALGKYWADNGITVVPTLSWARPSSYTFCFKGIPKHSTVATSTIGVARDKDVQKVWHDGMREAIRRLEPSLGAAFLLPETRRDMPITKPPGIESDPFKSAKWDELTQGREFAQSDAPALSLLCQWYKIADTAQDELDGVRKGRQEPKLMKVPHSRLFCN